MQGSEHQRKKKLDIEVKQLVRPLVKGLRCTYDGDDSEDLDMAGGLTLNNRSFVVFKTQVAMNLMELVSVSHHGKDTGE